MFNKKFERKNLNKEKFNFFSQSKKLQEEYTVIYFNKKH